MIVIIPTRRKIRLDYLSPLIDSGARFVIIDDTEGTVHIDDPKFQVFNWGDKRRVAGQFEDAFPGLNGACMSFGFYIAWKESNDDEIIVTLGDDCQVDKNDFCLRVREALSPATRSLGSVPGRFLNTIDMFQEMSPSLFSRGFPYSARMWHEPFEVKGNSTDTPSFNLGLWRNVFDINAIDKLNGLTFTFPEATLRYQSVVVPSGKLLSVSSGNMQFYRRLIPAVYQLPMHFPVSKNWLIDRFGDIWGGFVLKSLMDRVGDVLTVGEPTIFHTLAGYLEQNIWKEHISHLVNDEFIDLLDGAMIDVTPGRYENMVENLCEAFRSRAGRCSSLLKPYVLHLCNAWKSWTSALSSRDA